jgi:hypothetical protein
MKLRISRLALRLAVCRLPPSTAVPGWAEGAFVSITRTPDELSIVCDEEAVPSGSRVERGWSAFRVEGPLPFDAVGIAAALTAPIAAAGIPVLLIGTFDTDYLLVKEASAARVSAILRDAGHELAEATPPQ